jgi:E3 ubiquitin-protein ligase NRDP1
MIANSQGLTKERFPELTGDSFDCSICLLVSATPKECTLCGTMYCGSCIDGWVLKANNCPLGCNDAKNNIKPITGALAKMYRNLDVKCRFPNCNKIVKVSDLNQHEMNCQMPQCEFFSQCGNTVKPDFKNEGVCSMVCQFLKKIKGSNGDWKLFYKEIKALSNLGNVSKISKPIEEKLLLPVLKAASNFKWDGARMGHGIEISNGGKTVFLKENGYLFKSVISDTPMMGGVHYWEIHGDSRTENELKIGVATTKDFNYNTAYCDFEYGFAYYGLGQVRHNSNSLGGAYGKKFKKTGVLGICLDMNKGTLSFALDGECWGEAFKSDKLKKGPIFAAVALLHQAGCTMETGKPVPQYFLK